MSGSKRLLHVISSLDPRGGGPAEVVRQLAVALHRDHAIESVVLTLDDSKDPWLADFPLEAVALGPSRTGYRYCKKLVPWLQMHASKYQAVIVHGLWQYSSFGSWRALHRSSTPYFVYPHGMLDPWFKRRYPFKHLKKWLYWPWAEYRVLRDAKAVLFTCEQEPLLARQSFWLYRADERVVGLGIDAPEGDPEVQRQAFAGRFPELAGHRIWLFLGRLHEKKGCDLLLRAFAAVTEGGRNHTSEVNNADPRPIHLMMAGPCDDAGYLESLKALATSLKLSFISLISDHSVSFPGMLTGEVKWGVLRSAESFVLPSHQENFGIAVTEALACGTPVLISNQVNIWREIEAGGAGLVEDDTLTGTIQLLRRWQTLKSSQRDKMRARAKIVFRDHFEISITASSLVNCLSARSTNAPFTDVSAPAPSNRLVHEKTDHL